MGEDNQAKSKALCSWSRNFFPALHDVFNDVIRVFLQIFFPVFCPITAACI